MASISVAPQLSGCIPEVASTEYRSLSDEALDGEIVASVDAAHAHYNGLRRELVLRLLPALSEMRSRHSAQGTRNDLNVRLGLPRKAGWEDYLRSRGLKPDTVRNWFQKHAAEKTLALLVGGTRGSSLGRQQTTAGSKLPRLYRVSNAERVLIVAATSAKQAVETLAKSFVCLSEDSRPTVEELGQVLEVPRSHIWKRPVRQIPKRPVSSNGAMLKALVGNRGASAADIAKQLGASVVAVRRVATRHRMQLSSAPN
jgi:hypothetical protein